MSEIPCQLCEESISYSINDPNTFLSKVESGNPFTGKVFTLRLGHKAPDNVLHVNVIVVDEEGNFKTQKDAYSETDSSTSNDIHDWESTQRKFPFELRSYLFLASKDDKDIFNLSQKPESDEFQEWVDILKDLWEKNPSSNLIGFLASKMFFLTGQHLSLLEDNKNEQHWSYIFYLRLKGRKSPSKDLISEVDSLILDSFPPAIQLELIVAKSEIYIRTGAYANLEATHLYAQNEWGAETSLEAKKALMIVQSYYGFGQYRQGKLSVAADLIEPAFILAQLVQDQEMMLVIGTHYGNVLRARGDLKTALQVYQSVLDISKTINDERGQAVNSINMAIVETSQGAFETALNRLLLLLPTPTIQSETSLQVAALINISELYYRLENYEDSVTYAKQVLNVPNLPIQMRVSILASLKSVASKTKSSELLVLIKENIVEADYFQSPRGMIFQYDLKALEAELNNQWFDVVKFLFLQLDIMKENSFAELLNEAEIRLAESYFRLYQETKEVDYLNKSYQHLDVAKILSQESEYYDALCRIDMIKSIISQELGIGERAKTHLNEALKTAQDYNLAELEQQISTNLARLEGEKSEFVSNTILQDMFTSLRGSKEQDETTETSRPIKFSLRALWIKSKQTQWEIIFQTQDSNDEDVEYLKGFRDLYMIVGSANLGRNKTSFPSSRGVLMFENSDNFQVFSLCNKFDYFARIKFQKLLNDLEKFPLKHINEELTGIASAFLNKNIGEVNYMIIDT